MKPARAPTDTRKLRRDSERRLFLLTLFVLVVVGAGLIALSYGMGPAVVALTCLLFGAGLIGILWLIFTLIGRWVGEE
ncbi:MAG: hypothetical protein M1434_04705 [Chloroflexi bacterium]|nr:hypothetical protein [Chloroflexota bacterium]MCL5274033.1 hypothetical protein [Chloroflexota bacterium]